jgi:hypothetical protein
MAGKEIPFVILRCKHQRLKNINNTNVTKKYAELENKYVKSTKEL